MSTIPTPPTFASNDHSLANLQSLAACASFVGVVDPSVNGVPFWRLYKTVTQSIPATTLTVVNMGTPAVDTDGVSNGNGATIVTRGLYDTTATVAVQSNGTNNILRLYFRLTTGANNPLGAGVTRIWGTASKGVGTDTSRQVSHTINGTTPVPVYALDQIQVMAFAGGAISTVLPSTFGGGTGNCTPSFTGRYVMFQ
jgi:hypothetical protein